MNRNRLAKPLLLLLSTFLVAFLLSSCASSVRHSVSDYQYQGEKFQALSVSVTPELEAGLQNTDFDKEQLAKSITHQLKKHQLWDEDGGSASLQVYVDDIRIRSVMTALVFAFLAGDDHIRGDVTILDGVQNPLHTFRASTSFAMGGLVGSEGDMRWDWLYQSFAEQIVVGVRGN